MKVKQVQINFYQGFDSNAFFLVFYYDVCSRIMEFHEKLHSNPCFFTIFHQIKSVLISYSDFSKDFSFPEKPF